MYRSFKDKTEMYNFIITFRNPHYIDLLKTNIYRGRGAFGGKLLILPL